jgi:hypothetical protein
LVRHCARELNISSTDPERSSPQGFPGHWQSSVQVTSLKTVSKMQQDESPSEIESWYSWSVVTF